MASSLIIGTRGSRLALVQAHSVARDLEAGRDGLAVEVRVLTTKGDADRDASLDTFGGEGVFVKELERALVSGEIDAAVHSLKDLPTSLPGGLAIASVPERVDARDALISRDGAGLDDLPPGARVATGSPRRRAQLQHYRPDLRFTGIRGNIDTRLMKLEEPDGPDAIVLAVAGLQRLGWTDRISEVLSSEVCMPAVGQAALAIETRKDDRSALEAARRIEDLPARRAVTAERSFLHRIGGGCHTPVGAWGRIEEGSLVLDAALAADDGGWLVRQSLRGQPEEGEDLGRRLAEAVLDQAEQARQAGQADSAAPTDPARPSRPHSPTTESQ
ncbi:MAG: hydroxymethylbilane synthase [Gemmatimonadetes bacterium]|nr:hydroxymethylbilane synthase [Gemmatimonadota bacterium]MYG17645.1 hydroxymethylbilane synthase [Gemmatimonadota bacterium]